MTRWVLFAVCTLALAVMPAFADDGGNEKAPDFYIGPALEFDLEVDSTEVSIGFAGSGSSTVGPDFGLYDGKLLVGVQYMAFGKRADLESAMYGGPTLFWYDNHIGGGLVLGKHLSRRTIIEATYRATDDWQGQADLSLGYGFDWPWK